MLAPVLIHCPSWEAEGLSSAILIRSRSYNELESDGAEPPSDGPEPPPDVVGPVKLMLTELCPLALIPDCRTSSRYLWHVVESTFWQLTSPSSFRVPVAAGLVSEREGPVYWTPA